MRYTRSPVSLCASTTFGPLAHWGRQRAGAVFGLGIEVAIRGFIVDLEAGKPTLSLEHVLRVVDSLGGEFTLNGVASSQCEPSHPATTPTAANAHDARGARLQSLDELAAQAQELKMGYA